MIRPRKTLRRGEPTPAEKELARNKCYTRAGGQCELRLSPDCQGFAALNDYPWAQGQLAHLRTKRRFGWMESEENGQRHQWACPTCHRIQHAYGPSGVKPCPPK